jgi:ankyrin repeat protein
MVKLTELTALYSECTSRSPSMERIRQGMNAIPDVMGCWWWGGETPLHAVCRAGGGSLEIIQYLVEQLPLSVKTIGAYGRLPLLIACHTGAPLDVVQYLVGQYPKSVKTTDNAKVLPLHAACGNRASLEFVQYLVELWPESVKASTTGGSLPLHSACRHRAPLEVVQYLVGQWPESVKQRNDVGKTALDYIKILYFYSVMFDWFSPCC